MLRLFPSPPLTSTKKKLPLVSFPAQHSISKRFTFLFFFFASLPTSGFVSSVYPACTYWVHSVYGDPNVRVERKVYFGLKESSSSFKPEWKFIHSAGCVFGIHRCRLLKCHDTYSRHTAYDIRWKSTAYWIFAFMGQRNMASRHALWVLWFYAPLKVSWTNLIHTHTHTSPANW